MPEIALVSPLFVAGTDHPEAGISVQQLQAQLAPGWQAYFERLQAAQLGLAGYWWLANPDLKAALGCEGAVLCHWLPGLRLELQGNQLTLWHPLPELAAFALALVHCLAGQAQGKPLTFDRLWLPVLAPAVTGYLSGLAVRVEIGNGQLAGPGSVMASLPAASLQAPFITGNRRLLPMLADSLDFLRQPAAGSLTEQVYRLLGQAPDLRRANQAWVAETLAVSERSLTRQLAEEQQSFREILTRFRNARAIAGLCQGESIERLSAFLGFSERAAFERAFKSWQGVTPAKFQAQYRRLSAAVDIEALIGLDRLPNLPAIGVQLLDMARDENASLDDMARLVEQDPVLTAKLLSIASSAYYATAPGASIRDIVVRIFGVDKLRSLALAVLATGSFNLRHCPAFSISRFWLQSLGVAQLAADLYRLAGCDSAAQSEIYLAGLLHNIGRLVLVQCFPARMQALLEPLSRSPAPQELLAMEKLRLGVDTSEAGALLMAKWQLPREVARILRQMAADKSSMLREAALLTLLGEYINACIDGLKEGQPVAEEPWLTPLAQMLSVDEAGAAKLLAEFAARLPAMQAMADTMA